MASFLSSHYVDSLSVLYIDNHVIVINKPPGVVSHEDSVHSYSVRTIVANWIEKKFNKPKAFIVPVHRLDKGTSGAMLFAKTSKALSRLQTQGIQGQKIYHALVEPTPGLLAGQNNMVWHDYLLKGDFCTQVVSSDLPQAKSAKSKVEILSSNNDYSLLSVELLTGRYHQIRAQCAHHLKPIIGDMRYGSKVEPSQDEFYLHCYRLKFFHPVKREFIEVIAPYPNHMPLWK